MGKSGRRIQCPMGCQAVVREGEQCPVCKTFAPDGTGEAMMNRSPKHSKGSRRIGLPWGAGSRNFMTISLKGKGEP